jgi:glyoxylase-like metal-dependent hydrolase (beta-lactamase superfamily II)
VSNSSPFDNNVLQFAFDRKPEPAEAIDICAGIRWFRVPLPFALDHVNCWLLGEPGEQVLIDTGVDNEDTRKLWLQVQRDTKSSASTSSAQTLDQTPDQTSDLTFPDNLLITHYHPDHMGLAGEFFSHRKGLLAGSATEVDFAHQLSDIDDASYAHMQAQWYRAHGLPQQTVDAVLGSGNTYRNKVSKIPDLDRWTFLVDGQVLTLAEQSYRVITGRGHAPDMIMLYRELDHVLIAADQVLPSISPNVSILPLVADTNPLLSFLDTLTELRELPSDTLVLPSHGIPFRGLRERIDELQQHHVMRLQQVVEACAQPRTAYQLFSVLFRRALDPQQTSFALGESLSHLHYLEAAGDLTRIEENDITLFVSS